VSSIVFDHVSTRYADGFQAVKDMSLAINDAEFMILVGPSGSGKSTALRMVAGLENVTEGEIRIGDEVLNDKPPRDRDIAMVFQNYALYPHMTVRENLAFALTLMKTHERTSRARWPTPRGSSVSRRTSTASPRTSRAASVNAWRWGARSCAAPGIPDGRAAVEP
jgi:multiple sugar transport system ATP-binding protein